jgi:hypothetical protein
MNRMEGKTIRWTFNDGPVANESYEHAFYAKGGLSYRKVDGDDADESSSGTWVEKYESADINDDVSVFSYLAPDSGYTLTAVLDYGSNTVVAFASNEKMVAIQHGTFEELETDEKTESVRKPGAKSSGKEKAKSSAKKPGAPRAQAAARPSGK